MKHTFVGSSGLRVGNLGLGTLTWGRDTEDEDAHGMVAALLDHGGDAVDISPVYGDGLAQGVLGSVLAGGVDRGELVIIAHAGAFYRDGNAVRADVGRAALTTSLHDTLDQLGTDYVDVLMVAAPDPRLPVEETLGTIAQFVNQGAVRYIGLANHPAWRAARAAQYLKDLNLPHLSAVSAEYSVLQRGPERDLTAVAAEFGLGIFAHAPLAGGVLTGKYRHTIPPTSRAATEHLNATVAPYMEDHPRRTVEAVAKAADGLARTPADVSLAWLLERPQVASAFVGARTAAQFEQVLNLDLSPLPDPVSSAISDVA